MTHLDLLQSPDSPDPPHKPQQTNDNTHNAANKTLYHNNLQFFELLTLHVWINAEIWHNALPEREVSVSDNMTGTTQSSTGVLLLRSRTEVFSDGRGVGVNGSHGQGRGGGLGKFKFALLPGQEVYYPGWGDEVRNIKVDMECWRFAFLNVDI